MRVLALKTPAILLLTLIIFVPLREVFEILLGPAAKLLTDILVLIIALFCLYRAHDRISFTRLDAMFAALILISILSTVFNGSDALSAFIHIRGLCIFYILYFALRNAGQGLLNRPLILAIMRIVSLTVTFLVVAAIIEVLSGKQLMFPSEWVEDISRNNMKRAYSLIGNPNMFASYILMGMVLIKKCGMHLGLKMPHYLYVVAAIGIALSLSRSAMLAAAIAIVLFWAPTIIKNYYSPLGKIQRKRVVLLVALVALLIPATLLAVPNVSNGSYGENRLLDALNGNELRNSQIDGRFYIIGRAMDAYQQHGNYILGIGSGMANNQTDTNNMYELKPGFTSDNQFLKVVVELGITGAIIFLAFISLLIKRFKEDAPALITIILMLFLGLFYNSFEVQVVTLLFFLILAISELTIAGSLPGKAGDGASSKKSSGKSVGPLMYSLVIPTHNSSPYIANLLDSIPARDDIEILLVDDHSKDFDALSRLIKAYSSNLTIKLLQHTGVNSAGAARNVGLSAAQGKWVIFADSDDTFSDSLNPVLDNYKDSHASIILLPPTAVMFGTNEPSDRTEYIDYNFNLYRSKAISKEELSVRMTPIWSKIYRRDDVRNIKFSETRVANDVRWAAQAAFYTLGGVAVDDRSIYTVTERPGSLTRTKRFNIGKVARRSFERIKSDIWLKTKLLTHGHSNVKLARHRSVLRRVVINRDQ